MQPQEKKDIFADNTSEIAQHKEETPFTPENLKIVREENSMKDTDEQTSKPEDHSDDLLEGEEDQESKKEQPGERKIFFGRKKKGDDNDKVDRPKNKKTNKTKEAIEIDPHEKKPKRTILSGIIAITLVAGVTGGVVAYQNISGRPIGDLVNFNGNKNADVGNLTATEVAKLKQQVADIQTELSDVSRIERDLQQMKDNIAILEKELKNLDAKLQDDMQNWEQASNRRQAEISQIQDRLAKISTGEQEVTKKEFFNLAEKLSSLEQEHNDSIEQMKKQIHDVVKKADQLRDLKKKTGATVKPSPTSAKLQPLRNKYDIKTIKNIGHLKLETVNKFGEQMIAQLSDGISGALQVIKGDHIDKYQVEKITNEGVTLKEPNGTKLLLIKDE